MTMTLHRPGAGDGYQWVVDYSVGPDLVGPFLSQDEAEEWAASYAVEYRGAAGPLTLDWETRMLTRPQTLEWWDR